MPFEPKLGNYYRMPIFFGPQPGPRQWPEGRDFDFRTTPRMKLLGARMLTSPDQLKALLPNDRFELRGPPIITVEANYVTEIGWLAGRGYNICDVKFEVTYNSKKGPVPGTLVLVRWENLCDPIISGREELGHNKIYCEISEPRFLDDRHSIQMSWLGHPFLDLELWDLASRPDLPSPPVDPDHQGTLSYKYIPKTGEWGQADAEYVTLSPRSVSGANKSVQTYQVGKGEFAFRKSTWEELPTLYHIVNAFSELENHGFEGAYLIELLGASSLAETYRLD